MQRTDRGVISELNRIRLELSCYLSNDCSFARRLPENGKRT